MKERDDILSLAKNALKLEIEGIQQVSDRLNIDFVKSVNAILTSKGRVVITGIGKSAIIAQKIVATLNSTGTPAVFMHAADAIHGDLGMIQKEDIVVIISKSGESPEIKVLVPFIKNFGNTIVAISGNEQSFLVQEAHYFLNTTVAKEACPNNLAPTNSTTAQLVMGDALAVCLMNLRGFSSDDFAKYHPGGALGKKLLLRVNDMLENSLKPMVSPDSSIKKVIFEISEKRLGVTAVVENNTVIGIITDGDIRRMLTDRDTFSDLTAKDIMSKNPKTVQASTRVKDALNILEDFAITQLIVLDNGEYKGVLHVHDILKEGIV